MNPNPQPPRGCSSCQKKAQARRAQQAKTVASGPKPVGGPVAAGPKPAGSPVAPAPVKRRIVRRIVAKK